MQHSVAAKIAEYLLEIQAIKIQPDNPFTWASGWKSPIYSDNRLALSHPAIRTFIKKELSKSVLQKFPNVEAIIGVATAGIAPGALVADELNLPFGYVRSEPKKHGMGKQLEGDVKPQKKVVVVEDLVSTGKSSIQAIEAVRESEIEVLGLISVFTYGFDIAEENLKKINCPFISLCDYKTLLKVALEKELLKTDQIEFLNEWRVSPSTWKQSGN